MIAAASNPQQAGPAWIALVLSGLAVLAAAAGAVKAIADGLRGRHAKTLERREGEIRVVWAPTRANRVLSRRAWRGQVGLVIGFAFLLIIAMATLIYYYIARNPNSPTALLVVEWVGFGVYAAYLSGILWRLVRLNLLRGLWTRARRLPLRSRDPRPMDLADPWWFKVILLLDCDRDSVAARCRQAFRSLGAHMTLVDSAEGRIEAITRGLGTLLWPRDVPRERITIRMEDGPGEALWVEIASESINLPRSWSTNPGNVEHLVAELIE